MAKQQDPTPRGLEKASGEAGEREVQERVDAENEQGFRGARTDPTPLEHYTLQGVVAGLPTPETDDDALAAARAASAHTRG